MAGNTVGYAVRRLGRKRPELLARVEAGELSANRAMVEAGFRPHTMTIPIDPEVAARRIAVHFSGEVITDPPIRRNRQTESR
jgi:hypothetical protein